MTYGDFKGVVTGLLLGDTQLPQDAVTLKGLLSYALTTTATKAASFHLMTLDPEATILRLGPGDYLIRAPILPVADADIMDIDEELNFAVARFLASYISREKGGIHVQAADAIIRDYNSKAYGMLDQLELEITAPEVTEESMCTLTSEWYL